MLNIDVNKFSTGHAHTGCDLALTTQASLSSVSTFALDRQLSADYLLSKLLRQLNQLLASKPSERASVNQGKTGGLARSD